MMNAPQSSVDAFLRRRSDMRLVAPWAVLLLMPLAGMTDLKFGPIQVAEIYVELCVLLLSVPLLSRSRDGIGLAPRKFARPFKLFLVALIVGAVIGVLRGDLVVPSNVDTLFKRPGWLSLSRIVQFLLAYFCFSLIASYAVRSTLFFRQAVRWYLISAMVFSAYGIVSYVLLIWTGIDLGGAYGEEGVRLRALFVEGGPFGLYAISALILAFAQRTCRVVSRRMELTCYAVVGTALMMSGSKAAAIALVVTAIASLVTSQLGLIRKHLPSIFVVMAISVAALTATDTVDQLGIYAERREQLVQAGEQFKDDPNVVMGRIAGAVIVPNMLAEHPLLGVGIGNYSLLRDNALYRAGLPAVDDWDLHGLGLFGFTAETGAIGVALLIWTFSATIRLARRRRMPLQVTPLCFYPLMTLIFGAQPTFLYPWVLSALAFAVMERASPVPQPRMSRRRRLKSVPPAAPIQ